MASSIAYLGLATNEKYDIRAIDYIVQHRQSILFAATELGVSAGAIAGAMAEENHAYWNDGFGKPYQDFKTRGQV